MKQTGRTGVYHIGELVNEQMGWIFREQPTDDYGIDAIIETAGENRPTGQMIGVQIKTGKSYFKEQKDNCVFFRFDKAHADYWLNHSLPVIIVLYDPEQKLCIWQLVTKEDICCVSETSYKIAIPLNQTFSIEAKKELMLIAENPTPYEQKYNKLLVAKPWMNELVKGNTLILEAEHWVNKSSGRGSLEIHVIDNETGKETSLIEWPFVLFPGADYEDLFPQLFPWADFSVDSDFYEEYDRANFHDNCCAYDSEDGVYLPVVCTWEEWKESLPKIRPYETACGEVDAYRLILTLNNVGRAFCTLEDYMEN